MLNCGARAFDFRPKLDSGNLIFHHGSIKVDTSVKDAMQEILVWASKNGNAVEDMIVLAVTDCDGGDACIQALSDIFQLLKVPFIQDCSQLKGMNVSQAAALAKQVKGGRIFAMNSCWSEHFDDSISCSGVQNGNEYCCYEDSKALPFNKMWKYLDLVSAEGPPPDGLMYTHQALWQETTDSVAIGELHLSSLLLDESRSTLNALVTERIKNKTLDSSRINMVEINNVCDGGLALLEVLRDLE